MLFYLVCTESGELRISPMPTIQRDNPRKITEVLSPGLTLGFALNLLERVKRRGKTNDKEEVLKSLQKFPGLSALGYRWENVTPMTNLQKHNPESFVGGVKENINFVLSTQGRQLSDVDLQRLAQEIGLGYPEIIEQCNHQVQQGKAEWVPAVKKVEKGWRCMRCGETRVEEWPSIYGIEATCPACTALGALSSLQVFYRSRTSPVHPSPLKNKHFEWSQRAQEHESESILFSPRWELSLAQNQASNEVLEFVLTEKKKLGESKQVMLLWAACGAGKTEVCFPAAAWALSRGQNVLFAAPRQDVVLDVEPRLKRDFPGLPLSVLTGTSSERFAPAQFVLATTHQVLRFYQTFDLIFLDEMDAFPYHGNTALAWGLQQALRPSGKVVYLTATPTIESLEKVKRGQMRIVRLPARHHRSPLPVPEWRRFSWGLEGEKHEVRESSRRVLAHWVEELAENGPVFLFVPKISWVNPWVESLCKEFPQWEIEGSYSSDPGRREKIEGLRNRKYRAFVSTSILERGVTVPDAQVIVLSADHEIFEERALVQMAGRVGRTRENPKGKVIFLAKEKTSRIERAIRWIEEQNALALKSGLIDEWL